MLREPHGLRLTKVEISVVQVARGLPQNTLSKWVAAPITLNWYVALEGEDLKTS